MSADDELMFLRARVTVLEAQMKVVYSHLGLPFDQAPEDIDRKVMEALRAGNMMEAIKAYREIHRVGLNEAKQAVENMMGRK